MKRSLASAAMGLVLVTAVAFAYQRLAGTGTVMTTSADRFVKTLSPDQRERTVLAYDAPSRTDWHYIPKPSRKGLQIKEMNQAQRVAAHALLDSALSAVGYGKASQIMQLEAILRELEKSKTGSPLRDPERYYFTLFGEPTPDGRWGLSVEGHHLSLNFVVNAGKVVSSTPTFFGANPATAKADYDVEVTQNLRLQVKKGSRVLAKEEELAYDLLGSLTPEQRKAAIVAEKAPSDVRDAGKASPPISPAQGIVGRDLNPKQLATLRALVETYAHNLPNDVAAERLSAIEREGFEGITFAWSGSDKPEVGHHYVVQGKTFLIEFNNTQPDSAGNLANHIHSVWHNLAGNFDLPVER